jgi:hypothetical protein
MDDLVPSFRKDGIYTPEIVARINKASQTFNLPQNRIVPLVSYTTEMTKTNVIDKILFRVFQTAATVADTRIHRVQQTEIGTLLDS